MAGSADVGRPVGDFPFPLLPGFFSFLLLPVLRCDALSAPARGPPAPPSHSLPIIPSLVFRRPAAFLPPLSRYLPAFLLQPPATRPPPPPPPPRLLSPSFPAIRDRPDISKKKPISPGSPNNLSGFGAGRERGPGGVPVDPFPRAAASVSPRGRKTSDGGAAGEFKQTQHSKKRYTGISSLPP